MVFVFRDLKCDQLPDGIELQPVQVWLTAVELKAAQLEYATLVGASIGSDLHPGWKKSVDQAGEAIDQQIEGRYPGSLGLGPTIPDGPKNSVPRLDDTTTKSVLSIGRQSAQASRKSRFNKDE